MAFEKEKWLVASIYKAPYLGSIIDILFCMNKCVKILFHSQQQKSYNCW